MSRSVVLNRNFLLIASLASLLLAAFGWEVLGARPAATPASAAVGVRITMTVTGQAQGAFKGDDFATAKNATGLIDVLGYSAEIVSPRDPATGQATGKRIWKPIVVTHLLGGSSPEFLAAAATNENLTKVVISFFHTNSRGQEVLYYRVTLTNASLSDVRDYTSGGDVLEDDSFVFQKIEQEDLVAKTTFIAGFQTIT
jgi:type VI secretion system secreted protein Hcp